MGWHEELRSRIAETVDAFQDAPALPSGQAATLSDALTNAERLLDGLTAIGPIRGLVLTADANDAVDRVMQTLAEIRVALIAAREGQMTMKLRQEIEYGRMRFEDALAAFVIAVRHGLGADSRVPPRQSEALDDYLRQSGELLSARRLLREVSEARDGAVRAREETERVREETERVREATERVREDTQRAAGATADARLSQEFYEYARRERTVANWLRFACAAVLVAIAGVAAWLVWRGGKEDLTAWEELAQLGMTIPLGALAAYLGREAAHHRHHARWAAQLVVQLRTFDAFCAPMDDEQSAELRLHLGRRVFLSEVQLPGRGGDGADAPVDVLALTQQLVELTKSGVPARA